MVEYVGSQARIAFAREDPTQAYGTRAAAFGGTGGSTSPRFIGIANQAIDLPDKTLDVRQYRSFGTGRKWFLNKPGRRERNGTISFLPTTAELFYYGFGAETFTADTPSAGINTHVLTPANVPRLPSMTLASSLSGDPDFMRVYTGVTVDSLSLTLSESAELTCAMDIKAKNLVDSSDSATLGWDVVSPTLFTQPTNDGTGAPMPYMFHDRAANVTVGGVYDYTGNTMTLGSNGSTIARVVGFSCSINNNLKTKYYTQSEDAQDPFNYLTSYPDFSLSMEIVPAGKIAGDVDALYHYLESEIQGDVLIPFQAAADRRLDFVFEDCFFRTAPHSLPDDGSEIVVSVDVAPEEFRIVARDGLTAYSGL